MNTQIRITRSRGARARVFLGLLVLALAMALTPLAAHASVAPDAGQPKPLREESRWQSGNRGMALWSWPEGQRLFQLHYGSAASWDSLVAFDSSTLSSVGTAKLQPPAWGPELDNEYTTGGGRHHVAAVDRETGRVYVAYRTSSVSLPPSPGLGFTPAEGACTGSAAAADPGCVGGVHVLDGATLASVGKIPLGPTSPEFPRLEVTLKAMTVAPADPERGWGARLLLVVEEIAHGPTENSVVQNQGPTASNAVPRRNGANVAYAVSLDLESMRQEWVVRLEGCRNSRESRNWQQSPQGYPAAIFRGPDAVYASCHGSASGQGVVVRVPLNEEGIPAALPVQSSGDGAVDPSAEEPALTPPAAPSARQEVFPGPDAVTATVADPAGRRILMRVNDNGEVWWIFDTVANQFLGTIGIGAYEHGHTSFGLDPDTGRLYVVAAEPIDNKKAPGGLYLADTRRTPLAQALHYPDFADPARIGRGLGAGSNTGVGFETSVEPRGDDSSTRIFVTTERKSGATFRRLVDDSPVSVNPGDEGEVVRTLDISESPGITDATFDGTARGFGFRTILLGGAEGAARVGPADPVGVARGVPQMDGDKLWADVPMDFIRTPLGGVAPAAAGAIPNRVVVSGGEIGRAIRQVAPPPDPCTDSQRELIVAMVGPKGPAVVDASSSRGEAQAVLADVRTRDDIERPISRCSPYDWQALWDRALVTRAPVEEPGTEWPFEEGVTSCTTTTEDSRDSWSDPVFGLFSAQVECTEDGVTGWSQARGVNLEGLSVAHTLSSFRIYRDPGRGMVARVESIARGIEVPGLLRIDTVRGAAESWANGRKADESEETTPQPFNCDFERPAGTCFQRHVFGVAVMKGPGEPPAYKCGPCGDETALIEGINRGLGAYGMARFREPDPELARGADDGFMAAITKRTEERFADIVLNADLLETMVPMLEIIRYAPHNRPAQGGDTPFTTGTPPRGRQVYQFAAVEVSSTYGIQCLLVYDEATNTCAGEKQVPGAIQVSLSDPDGKALAGGAFEVRQDVDADGVLGLKDTLLPDGACVTTDDGVGTCTFEALQPGAYLVNQVAAPPGYAKSAEPFVVELASGEQRTVAFTNVSNLSTVELKATDENGAPVSGAVFAAYPDPDSDGKVAPDAKPAAECTTDAQGACSMQVPAGSYVLVQTSAPAGLEGIEPVAFTFASGGQVAAVTVVNYPPETPGTVEPEASPVIDYSPPVDSMPPTEMVDESYVAPEVAEVPETVDAPVLAQVGDTITQVIRAPGDALRLLARDPKEAVAWTAALALFCLAVMAIRRRQQAIALIQQ